jgi:hypothetical protein
MNLKFLITLSFFTLLAGCASSPDYVALDKFQKSTNIKPISQGEQLSLTYRFSPMMIKSERKEFFDYLQKEDNQKELSSLINDSIETTKGVGLSSFLYTTRWKKAVASGDLLNEFGVTALVGASVAAATNWLTERHQSLGDYKLYDENPENLTNNQLTEKYRKKTYDAIYEFAKKYNYDIKCSFGCESNQIPTNKDRIVFLLESKEKSFNGHYKPQFLSIVTNLKKLETSQADDSILINQQYNYKTKQAFNWYVNVDSGVVRDSGKAYLVTLSDGSQVYGESVFKNLYMGNLFYRFLTAKLKGYSMYYYNGHNNVAFYNGNAYRVKDKLENNSIIAGIMEIPNI